VHVGGGAQSHTWQPLRVKRLQPTGHALHDSIGGHASQIVPLQSAEAVWHSESVVQTLQNGPVQTVASASTPSAHVALSVQHAGLSGVGCVHEPARLHGDPDPAANAAEQVEISGVATSTT
jgi:hypothetical protein